MCICKICNKTFEANKNWHHETWLCSDDCRILQRRKVKMKYKNTEKWKIAEERWVKSDKRKENERNYQQKKEYKAKAVIRQTRYLREKPELRKLKYIRDSLYFHFKRCKEAWKIDRIWWFEKLDRLWWKCQICWTTEKITIDHIIPLSKWWMNTIDNLQPLCQSCNSRKGNRTNNQLQYA